MAPLPEKCQQQDCCLPRTWNSIYCEQHHHEQLVRAGLIPAIPPDPCEEMPRKCLRYVKHNQVHHAITDAELDCQLMNTLVHVHTKGLSKCWNRCFEAIPVPVLRRLLAYAKDHPEPRVFRPVREGDEKAALAAQHDLIVQLEQWLSDPPPTSSATTV